MTETPRETFDAERQSRLSPIAQTVSGQSSSKNAAESLVAQSQISETPSRKSAPADANVHAREYQLYLPSKDLLKRKLLEWTAEEGV